jgi:CRISPR-associated endonuclease/helicase Cas3
VPDIDFASAFTALTGNAPFPWQQALYERFLADPPDNIPASCNLPTGLGKTSVIAVWLVALATRPDKVPRRLVYVVNRRTVVDQTTTEVEKYRDALTPDSPLANALWKLCAIRTKDEVKEKDNETERPLAISTLRGQYADNREWSADPARPAVICGTVDMIGSRLLFSGYGCGFKTRPLHAGFLGQDALLVHDEAHLEPAFQKLLLAIECEQRGGRLNDKGECVPGEKPRDFRPLRVMELTATSRAGDVKPFGLTDADYKDATVTQRVNAKKTLHLHENKDEKKLAEEIATRALAFKDTKKAILVFVRKVEDVEKVVGKLQKEKQHVQQLTGTLRGLERDRMADPRKADGCPIFARFLKPPKDDVPENERWKVKPTEGTVYLVCTSAGEVGVNISADHLVCDLSTFESMAQRFGRVNRFGTCPDTRIDVIHPPASELPSDEDEAAEKKKEKPNALVFVDAARRRTLELLGSLNGSASPAALGDLNPTERQAAFAPQPTILPVSDILFDAWALTTVRDKLPGRPLVEPYLHGVAGWEPPTTHVAWREEVWVFRTTDSDGKPRVPEPDERKELAKRAEDLLEDYPLKPHELLGDRTDRVFKHLGTIAGRNPHLVAWLVDEEGTVQVFTLDELADKDKKDRLNNQTVLLAPQAGGLRDGLLAGDATETTKLDVADEWYADEAKQVHRRLRLWDDDPPPGKMRLVRPAIDTKTDADDAEEPVGKRYWQWYELPTGDGEGSKAAATDDGITWDHHTRDVVKNAKRIGAALFEDRPELRAALDAAAQWHDLGKMRAVWQRSIGNPNPKDYFAKSAKGWKLREATDYRHEFGSLIDAAKDAGFTALKDEWKEFVLHLIAAHHGRGRPHFPADEAFDPERSHADAERVARETPRRFATLQRRYGRWGLAYLESLLRAADYAASASPSKYEEGTR